MNVQNVQSACIICSLKLSRWHIPWGRENNFRKIRYLSIQIREIEGNKNLFCVYLPLTDYLKHDRGHLNVSWHSNEAMSNYNLRFNVCKCLRALHPLHVKPTSINDCQRLEERETERDGTLGQQRGETIYRTILCWKMLQWVSNTSYINFKVNKFKVQEKSALQAGHGGTHLQSQYLENVAGNSQVQD